jgi:quercetin dioxygenase-like cupin family protein
MVTSIAKSNEDPRYTTSGALHVRTGEGPTFWGSGDVYTLKATRETTDGWLGLVEATVPPGGGPIAHVHTRANEAFYVLAGEVELLDGDRTFIARTGDFAFIPRGIRHRFKNTGVRDVLLLFLFTPGGDELGVQFLDEPTPGEPPPAWEPERFARPELLEFFVEAGMQFLTDETAAGDDPRYTTRGAVHVPAGEGVTTWFSGDTYTIKASAESTNGALGVVEASVPAGGGPVAHAHGRTDEAFYVLSGEVEVLDGGRTFMARAGDFVFIPRGIRHRFKNRGAHSARLLFLFTPAGEERVFRYGDEPQPGVQAPAWGIERFSTPEILRFNEESGVAILPE